MACKLSAGAVRAKFGYVWLLLSSVEVAEKLTCAHDKAGATEGWERAHKAGCGERGCPGLAVWLRG